MPQERKLTGKQILLLIGAIPFNFLCYYLGRALGGSLPHHVLSTALDAQIPFFASSILIYWGCYLFWFVNYPLSVMNEEPGGCRFLRAHYIAEFICLLFFVLLPTSMVRPTISGSSLLQRLVALTYAVDAPDNLFPSIHCFASWLCWIGVRKNARIPKWYRVVSLLLAVSVCVSTLTVKQHMLADVPAGIAVAELSWLLSGRIEKKRTKAQ